MIFVLVFGIITIALLSSDTEPTTTEVKEPRQPMSGPALVFWLLVAFILAFPVFWIGVGMANGLSRSGQ